MRVVEGIPDVGDPDALLAELSAIGDDHGCLVQAFDAQYVLGRRHLERALELADRAFDREENVARDRAVEVLLYAAGRRQIDRALEMGVAAGEHPVVVLLDGGDEAGAAEAVRDRLRPADTLAVEHADAEAVREFFDVSPAEEAVTAGDLQDLVLERVALLDVEK